MKQASGITGYNSAFVGFSFFLGKPKLWLIPLLSTLVAWLMLFCLFVVAAYHSWPAHAPSHLKYTLKIFQALGIGAFVALCAWIVIVPLFLNLCFESLLKRVCLAKGDTLQPTSFFKTMISGVYIFTKTLGWRVFWIVLTLLTVLAFGPASLVIAQIGIAHITLVDSCDLSLSLKGVEGKERIKLIRKNRLGILSGGIIAGLVSFFLMPTVLVWLFWIPSIYIGACLWVREWAL